MAEEQKLQTKIIQFLHKNKIYSFKTTGVSVNGVPDIICCLSGNFIGIEVKSEKGRIDGIQEYNHKRITKSGGTVFVVRPNSFENFCKQIEKIKTTIDEEVRRNKMHRKVKVI